VRDAAYLPIVVRIPLTVTNRAAGSVLLRAWHGYVAPATFELNPVHGSTLANGRRYRSGTYRLRL